MPFLNQLGLLALGSRLKGLSDKLYSLADEVYRQRGLQVQGRWFPLLRLLHDLGPSTVGEAAAQIGQSHSAVSQLAQRLQRAGLLVSVDNPSDRRCRRLALSVHGSTVLRQARPLWRAISASLAQRSEGAGVDILDALQRVESIVDDSLLPEIVGRCAVDARASVRIVPFTPELREHFYRLNEAWVRKYFYLEEIDHRVLSQPEQEIIEPGGAIWFALLESEVVGTCALKAEAPGVMELSKMGVDERYQGLGIGRALIQAALAECTRRGAKRVFLETNDKLRPAIALYESVGFVRQAQRKPNSQYVRSDVYMIWQGVGSTTECGQSAAGSEQ